MIKAQLTLFFTALAFLTQIPCAQWADHSEDGLNRASRFFPLVGIVVGCIGAIVWWAGRKIFPQEIAVLISMAATIWVTGAFHEDGLADTADGLGGGWTKEQALTIMKDSRIGSYGAVALIMALMTKFHALSQISAVLLPWVMIAGHGVSRLAPVLVIRTQQYQRESGTAKPLANEISNSGLMIATFFGLVPLLMLPTSFWCALVPTGLTWLWFSRKLKQRLGGYTGDCLGAMQQICELAFYLGVLACASL